VWNVPREAKESFTTGKGGCGEKRTRATVFQRKKRTLQTLKKNDRRSLRALTQEGGRISPGEFRYPGRKSEIEKPRNTLLDSSAPSKLKGRVVALPNGRAVQSSARQGRTTKRDRLSHPRIQKLEPGKKKRARVTLWGRKKGPMRIDRITYNLWLCTILDEPLKRFPAT